MKLVLLVLSVCNEDLILSPPQLQVDIDLLDFGTHVVGQTISRILTLINRGALGTHFTLEPSSRASAHRRPESSPGPPSQQPSTTEDARTQQQVGRSRLFTVFPVPGSFLEGLYLSIENKECSC